jgi:hypothetical protein
VLAAGHYNGPATGTHLGQHAMTDRESWHTDCPQVTGMNRPLDDHDHRHLGGVPPETCMVWADTADGATPSEVTVSQPDPDSEIRKGTGRTVTDLGNYEATVMIGGASMRARGPARFVAYLVREFATAFEEESER